MSSALYAAAARGAAGPELQALLAASPEAAFAEDALTGFLPLHAACAVRPVPDPTAVAVLLQANPGAARARGIPGQELALHLACGVACLPENEEDNAAAVSVVAQLLAASPEACSAPERRGRCPLHVAAASGAPHALSRSLIAADRRVVAALDAEGRCATHCAAAGSSAGRGARGQASAQTLQLLLEVAPSSAARTDTLGRLPLHAACAAGAPPAVIKLLMDAHPAGVTAKDSAGRTPLHHLVLCPSPEAEADAVASPEGPLAAGEAEAEARAEGASLLLSACPSLLSLADAAGDTPSLLAFSAPRAPLALLERLAAASALAAAPGPPLRERSAKTGETIMHLAAARAAAGGPSAAAGAVKLLLRLAPDLAGCGDARGATPLHAACEAGASTAVLALLIPAHPPALTQHFLGLPPLAAWLQPDDRTGQPRRSAEQLCELYEPLCAVKGGSLALRAAHQLAPVPAAAQLLGKLTDTFPDLPDELEPPFETVGVIGGGDECADAPFAPGPKLSALQLAAPACRAGMLCAGRLLRRFQPPVHAEGQMPKLWLECEDAKAPKGSYHRRCSLKFTESRAGQERELARRAVLGGNARCEGYLPVLASFSAAGMSVDALYAEEARLRHLPPFLIVLPRADATLCEAMAQRPDKGLAGRDWRAARRLASSLLLALQPLHEGGLVHCALCPAHIVRLGDSLGGEWRLLGAAHSCSQSRQEYITAAVATAYSPPELCRLVTPAAALAAAAAAAAAAGDSSALSPPPMVGEATVTLRLSRERAHESADPGALRADVSLDMWALGCVLYQVFMGEPLWKGAACDPQRSKVGEESLSPEGLMQLASWDYTQLDERLQPLHAAAKEAEAVGCEGHVSADAAACRSAAALLRWLLQPQPGRRPPSVYGLLGHAFLNPAGGMLQAERWVTAQLGLGGGDKECYGEPVSPSAFPSAMPVPEVAAMSPPHRAAAPAPYVEPASPLADFASSIFSAVASLNLSSFMSLSSTDSLSSMDESATPVPSHGAPPPAASRAPPPAALVGAFPLEGLSRLNLYDMPADAEAPAAAPPPVAVHHAPPLAPEPLPISWADPLPPPPPGTVAATRTHVGVRAVEGGAGSPATSPRGEEGLAPAAE